MADNKDDKKQKYERVEIIDVDQEDDEIDIAITDMNKQGSLPQSLARFKENKESEDYILYARKAKFILTLSFITAGIILLMLHLNVYKTILVFCSVDLFLIVFGMFMVITSAKSLYWIEIEVTGIYGYKIFYVPNKVIQKYHTTITSVSALSALPGSITHNLMTIGTSTQYCSLLIAIVVKSNEWNEQQQDRLMIEWIGLYSFFVGIVGVLVIGLWWIEKDSKFSTILHYSGALSFLVLVSFGFVLYQRFSIFSICLGCLQGITAIVWFIMIFRCPSHHKDREKVDKISYYCILSELFSILIAGVNGACFIYCMDGDIIMFG